MVWLYQHKELRLYLDVSRVWFTDEFAREIEPRLCFKHDNLASVSYYFKPKHKGVGEDEGLPLQEAHFRGRLLQGTTLPLPHGYSGFVLSKSSPPTSDENSHSWDTKATFQDITYWNHDYSPSQNDELFRAFHWLTVAKALHNPVTPEELASSSVTL